MVYSLIVMFYFAFFLAREILLGNYRIWPESISSSLKNQQMLLRKGTITTNTYCIMALCQKLCSALKVLRLHIFENLIWYKYYWKNQTQTSSLWNSQSRWETNNRQNHISKHKMTTGISAVKRYPVLWELIRRRFVLFWRWASWKTSPKWRLNWDLQEDTGVFVGKCLGKNIQEKGTTNLKKKLEAGKK